MPPRSEDLSAWFLRMQVWRYPHGLRFLRGTGTQPVEGGLAAKGNQADGTQVHPRQGLVRVGRSPPRSGQIPARTSGVSALHRSAHVKGDANGC